VEVLRVPNALCTDRGRAINNSLEPGWENTLTGFCRVPVLGSALAAGGIQNTRPDRGLVRRRAWRHRLLAQMGRFDALRQPSRIWVNHGLFSSFRRRRAWRGSHRRTHVFPRRLDCQAERGPRTNGSSTTGCAVRIYIRNSSRLPRNASWRRCNTKNSIFHLWFSSMKNEPYARYFVA